MAEIYDKKIAMPELIIFDWDGVLVDTKDLIKDAYFATFKALGQTPIDIDTIHQLPGTSLRDYFPKIFGNKSVKAEEIFYKYVHENHISALKATEGSHDLLTYLKALKIPLAVISNKRGDLLRKEAKHLGYDVFFYDMVGSKDCVADKPSTVPVTRVLSKRNIKFPTPSVWFVGDWKVDLECANAAGLTPVLFNNAILRHAKDKKLQSKIYVESCLDLKNLLNQYIKGA